MSKCLFSISALSINKTYSVYVLTPPNKAIRTLQGRRSDELVLPQAVTWNVTISSVIMWVRMVAEVSAATHLILAFPIRMTYHSRIPAYQLTFIQSWSSWSVSSIPDSGERGEITFRYSVKDSGREKDRKKCWALSPLEMRFVFKPLPTIGSILSMVKYPTPPES